MGSKNGPLSRRPTEANRWRVGALTGKRDLQATARAEFEFKPFWACDRVWLDERWVLVDVWVRDSMQSIKLLNFLVSSQSSYFFLFHFKMNTKSHIKLNSLREISLCWPNFCNSDLYFLNESSIKCVYWLYLSFRLWDIKMLHSTSQCSCWSRSRSSL